MLLLSVTVMSRIVIVHCSSGHSVLSVDSHGTLLPTVDVMYRSVRVRCSSLLL